MNVISAPLKINLTRERLNAGETIRSLGRRLKLNPETIKRAESGDPISVPSAKTIADFYGRKVDEIWDLNAVLGAAA